MNRDHTSGIGNKTPMKLVKFVGQPSHPTA